MTSLGSRVQSWVDLSVLRDDWVTCRVESRVDFLVDGRAVSDLNPIDASPEHVTVFDLVDTEVANDILLGRADLTEGFPPAGWLPLLVCPCGDPGEGTLTVRLTLTEDIVVWDRWAWESDVAPAEELPDLPECRFRRDEYTAAVREAGRLARAIRGQVSSIIRVPRQGDGILRWIDTRIRGELACQLDWLDLEVVHPPVEDRSPELSRLLEAVTVLRDALTPEQAGRRLPAPGSDPSQRALRAASQVLASPEAFRLPEESLEAVEWLHGYISSEQEGGVFTSDPG
jgi:hypothetical protein